MFEPGQLCECVDAGPMFGSGGPSGLMRGGIYTVASTGAFLNQSFVLLVEVSFPVSGDTISGWNADRFRPLQDSKLEVFRALLVDLPALPKFEPTKEKVS